MNMIGTLRNRWLLLRLAAGISRADTPRERVLNALRAVNFVLLAVAFAFPMVFIGTLPMVFTGTLPNNAWYTDAPFITAYLAVVFIICTGLSLLVLPKLIGVRSKATELRGLLLAFAVSSFPIGAFSLTIGVLSIDTYSGITDTTLIFLVFLLILVVAGRVFWRIRRNYAPTARKLGFIANMAVYIAASWGWVYLWLIVWLFLFWDGNW